MQKRKFDELISHFNRKVSDMSIDQKYKMELLGMISAIGFAHEKELSTNLAEVGTDCISRQRAIDAIEHITTSMSICVNSDECHGMKRMQRQAVIELANMPAIQPKRGRWLKLDMHIGMADHKCTVCKQECYVPTCMGEPMYAFCPNCGADMRQKGENSENN